jgi:hypothetical protein
MSDSTTSNNSGQEWTDDQVQQLHAVAEGNTPVGVMRLTAAHQECLRRPSGIGNPTLDPHRPALGWQLSTDGQMWRRMPSGSEVQTGVEAPVAVRLGRRGAIHGANWPVRMRIMGIRDRFLATDHD